MKFTVTVDGGKPYSLEAANSFEAWDKAFDAHPDAGRVEVTLSPLEPRPMSRAHANDRQVERLQAVVEPTLATAWSEPVCGN